MEQGNCMKTIKKKLIEAKRVFCFILACVLCVTAGSSFVYAKEEDSDQGILVEGEDYSEINFELYEYEKDPGLSGGDFLLMKAPAGAVPPEQGFLAKYEIDVLQLMEIWVPPLRCASMMEISSRTAKKMQ